MGTPLLVDIPNPDAPRRRKIAAIAIAGAALTLAGAGVGAFTWRGYVVRAQEDRGFALTQRLLKEGRAAEALAVAQTHTGEGKDGAKSRHDWAALELEAMTAAGDVGRLATVYKESPARLDTNEQAALLVARTLASPVFRDPKGAAALAERWKSKTKHPEWWLYAQADNLLAQGKRKEAEKLLKANHFAGDADTGRLTRLAMLCNVGTHAGTQAAWSYLTQAYALNPRDPDVRTLRGQILEGSGKRPGARIEYVAARVAQPNSALYCDQLADFYRRSGDYANAVQTWADGLSSCPTDLIAVRTLFWTRMANPASGDWSKKTLPPGELNGLAAYIKALPADRFFDSATFDSVAGSGRLSERRQEVYWLRLAEALREGSDAQATHMIANSPFRAVSWNPELERALVQVLAFRRIGKVTAEMPAGLPAPRGERHPLLERLDAAARSGGKAPADLAAFLKSDEAFAATFLAAGWWEAGLRLRPSASAAASKPIPAWYAYGVTQALRANQSAADAIAFAEKVTLTRDGDPISPAAFDESLAEALIADGKIDKGLALLRKHARDASEVGKLSSWMLALAALERGKPDEAEKIVAQQPRLAKDVTGGELLGRAALARGDKAGALRRYTAIAATSAEAKAFLANQAFERKDWNEAERRTRELLYMMPDELQLRANMEAIANARRGGAPTSAGKAG